VDTAGLRYHEPRNGFFSMAFQIFSTDFAQGGWIPDLHSCQGADISPSLEWSGATGFGQNF
jgi:phosphatidylethanolamine-binding protein (PEBP) family uncharacterized protein